MLGAVFLLSNYRDTLEKVKLTFDEQGIAIPFPQMDVHIKKEMQE